MWLQPETMGHRSCGPRACQLLEWLPLELLPEAGHWGFEDVSVLATIEWRNCLQLSLKLLLLKLSLDQNLSSWSLGSGVGTPESTVQPPRALEPGWGGRTSAQAC